MWKYRGPRYKKHLIVDGNVITPRIWTQRQIKENVKAHPKWKRFFQWIKPAKKGDEEE